MAIRVQPVSRRTLLGKYALPVLTGLLAAPRGIAQISEVARSQPATLVDHPRGQYSFIRGIPAYSGGVVARAGFEIVHANFARLRPLHEGFTAIEEHFTDINVPKIALCALELRSPLAFSSEAFRAFNSQYVELLRSWNILLEHDVNPIARTNVAPVLFPPSEPSVFGFSYVARSSPSEKTFVVAGGGELPDGSINAEDIVRRGDSSPAAMLEKAGYVKKRMNARLSAMNVKWADVTAMNVYTAHELTETLVTEVLDGTGHNAINWNYARPPIKDLEFEMDMRGVRREIIV